MFIRIQEIVKNQMLAIPKHGYLQLPLFRTQFNFA